MKLAQIRQEEKFAEAMKNLPPILIRGQGCLALRCSAKGS
jgi:hypothetical protein